MLKFTYEYKRNFFLQVGVLVNNAGMSYDHPELFTNITEETITNILQLNVAATTAIARAVLPGMMERRKGVIINISSTAAAIPSPYLSVYAASKAFVDKLSADLAVEAAPRNVTIQCVLPGPVATKMSKIKYVRYFFLLFCYVIFYPGKITAGQFIPAVIFPIGYFTADDNYTEKLFYCYAMVPLQNRTMFS